MKENSIKEDITRIKQRIEDVKEYIEYGLPYSEYLDLENSFDNILSAYERVLKENEEYSKQLDLDYVDKNYIPKQKIKAKIEELNKTINKCGIIYSLKQCARCQKDVLEKLLIEESED